MKRRFVIAVATSTIGCAAVLGLGDYEVGREDVADGSAPTIDAPMNTTDAPIITTDAGVDAASVLDATTHYCATLTPIPTFCADFDLSDDPANGWDPSTLDASASRETVTNRFVSSPRALHATTTSSYAILPKSFTNVKAIQLEADVMVPIPPATDTAVSPISLWPHDPELQIWFYVSGTTGVHYFQRGSVEYTAPVPKPPPFDFTVWHHVVISVQVLETSTVVDASMDGTLYWQAHTIGKTWPLSNTITLMAGAVAYKATIPVETWVDNVVVRAQ